MKPEIFSIDLTIETIDIEGAANSLSKNRDIVSGTVK